MAKTYTQPYWQGAKLAWTVTPMVTANTSRTGTSGTLYYLKSAGGSDFAADGDDSFLQDITLIPLGTNVASVVRVFVNNGSSDGTEANNILIHEQSLPATTSTEAAGQTPITLTVNKALPSGAKVFLTIGTAVSAGWKAWAGILDY